MAQEVKNLPAMQEIQVQSLGQEYPLKKGMDTHSSNLAWRIVVIHSLSCIQLSVSPRAAVHQASLSFPISQCLLKFMPTELVMLSNHLILCCPLLMPSIFPSIRVFPMSWLFASGGQNIRASASVSVLLMNVQGWFPLGLTGLIPLQPKGLSRILSSTTIQKHQCLVHVKKKFLSI